MSSLLEILAADLARLPDETLMRIVAAGGGSSATYLSNDCRTLKAIRARERVRAILAGRPEGTLEILRFGPAAVSARSDRPDFFEPHPYDCAVCGMPGASCIDWDLCEHNPSLPHPLANLQALQQAAARARRPQETRP